MEVAPGAENRMFSKCLFAPVQLIVRSWILHRTLLLSESFLNNQKPPACPPWWRGPGASSYLEALVAPVIRYGLGRSRIEGDLGEGLRALHCQRETLLGQDHDCVAHEEV